MLRVTDGERVEASSLLIVKVPVISTGSVIAKSVKWFAVNTVYGEPL